MKALGCLFAGIICILAVVLFGFFGLGLVVIVLLLALLFSRK